MRDWKRKGLKGLVLDISFTQEIFRLHSATSSCIGELKKASTLSYADFFRNWGISQNFLDIRYSGTEYAAGGATTE